MQLSHAGARKWRVALHTPTIGRSKELTCYAMQEVGDVMVSLSFIRKAGGGQTQAAG